MSQNDLEGALAHLRLALAIGGENPLVLNNIGAAELRRGRQAEGIYWFRRALKINPCRFDARLNLMRALANAGEKENAILAGVVPADCRLLPEQAEKIEDERRSIR
jgi:tetratricopeptide (TPR) repeat protein